MTALFTNGSSRRWAQPASSPSTRVAIEEDGSALRFRRVEHIARLRRDSPRALTATGRARAGATRSSRG
jgi:hypothetical protein